MCAAGRGARRQARSSTLRLAHGDVRGFQCRGDGGIRQSQVNAVSWRRRKDAVLGRQWTSGRILGRQCTPGLSCADCPPGGDRRLLFFLLFLGLLHFLVLSPACAALLVAYLACHSLPLHRALPSLLGQAPARAVRKEKSGPRPTDCNPRCRLGPTVTPGTRTKNDGHAE